MSLKHVMEIMPSRLVLVITTGTIFQLINFTQFRELSVARYLVGHVLYAQTVLGLVVSKSYIYQFYLFNTECCLNFKAKKKIVISDNAQKILVIADNAQTALCLNIKKGKSGLSW